MTLRQPVASLVQLRKCFARHLRATACCLHPSEGAALQSCDVFFDFAKLVEVDLASGLPGISDTACCLLVVQHQVEAEGSDPAWHGHPMITLI